MEHYVGLDVSPEADSDLHRRWDRKDTCAKGRSHPNPEAISAFIKSHAPHVVRIGLETGATSIVALDEAH